MAKSRTTNDGSVPTTKSTRVFEAFVRTDQFGIKVMSVGIGRRNKDTGEELTLEQRIAKAEGAVLHAAGVVNDGADDSIVVAITDQRMCADRLRTAFAVLGAQEYQTNKSGTSREGEDYVAKRWVFVVSHHARLSDHDAIFALETASVSAVWDSANQPAET